MRACRVPLHDSGWCEFVESHPDATLFHTPAWAQLLADCYRFDAFALTVRDTDGEVLAGVPTLAVGGTLRGRRWVSLPFSDSCDLLKRPGVDPGSLTEALRELVFGSGIRELEIRTGLPAIGDVYSTNVGSHFALDLPEDPAELHPHKLHRNTRNRAQRDGVEVVRGSEPSDIAEYYRLHTLTRRRLGVPVQPYRFFDLISERFITTGKGFVASALLDGKVVAAGVYLTHKSTMVAKFGASDPDSRDNGAGYLIDWETMVSACREGYRLLDFGRTDLGADGLRRYKSGWDAVETPLVYSHIARRKPDADLPDVGELPKRIIRHSPVWVCRALGELFYRGSA